MVRGSVCATELGVCRRGWWASVEVVMLLQLFYSPFIAVSGLKKNWWSVAQDGEGRRGYFSAGCTHGWWAPVTVLVLLLYNSGAVKFDGDFYLSEHLSAYVYALCRFLSSLFSFFLLFLSFSFLCYYLPFLIICTLAAIILPIQSSVYILTCKR